MHKTTLRRLAWALFAPAVSIAAIEPLSVAPGGEAAFFDEMPVVLSVTRLQQNLHDVPGFVTVIDREAILHSGARDLAELLRAVPGFQVAFNPSGAPVAAYHGMGDDVPKGLQVLIDGRSQYSPLIKGGVDWNLIDVPLEDIERIEVLRGSNSAAFGSNAFMGVVNVTTRHADDSRGWQANGSAGNQGIADRYARVGFGGERWSARLSASSQRDDGEPIYFDDRRTERYSLRSDIDFGARDHLRLLGGLTRAAVGRGFPPNSDALRQLTDPHREAESETGYLQANWRHSWSPTDETELRLYRVRQIARELFSVQVAVPPFVLTTDFNLSGKANRDDLELQHTTEIGWTRLVGGYGWQRDEAEHEAFYGAGRQVAQTTTRWFGQIELQPVGWATVNLGATDEDHSNSGHFFSPRGALNLHLTPNQTVKLIVGKSRRLPTLYEKFANERLFEKLGTSVPVGTLLFVDGNSTGTVKPEEVVSREVGYFGDFRPLGLRMDARLFEEKLKNRIRSYLLANPAGTCPLFEVFTSPPCGDFADFFNVIDATIRGWEAQVAWQATPSTQVGLTYARVRIDARWASTRPVDPPTVDFLARSAPRHSASLSVRHRLFDRLTLAAAYYDLGAFKWTRNGRTDAYRRLDWRLAYDFRVAAARAELAWTVRNDGSNHAEWFSRNDSGNSTNADLIGTRHFVSLRIEY